jgi:4-amino-4-deoxy-L-arabinose transferase-like glycosyltransferase
LLASWPRLAPAIPVAIMLAIGLWGLGRPSYWRDESVSVVVGHEPLPAMLHYLRSTDAVHGLYYLLLHPVTALGTSETVTRLPSVLAAAAAAGGIAVLGRRFSSPAAGLSAGLIYAVLPLVSRYAQEVRQYAMVSAGAVLATYLLTRALETPRPRAGWYAGYALTVSALGWLHLYALFLLAAHVVTVVLLEWRRGPQWGSGRRGHVAAWAAATGAALMAVLPLVLIARGQQAQVAWLSPPGSGAFLDFGMLVTGGTTMLTVVLGLAVIGATVLTRTTAEGTAVVLPWLVLPITAVTVVSQLHPVYQPRYLLYTVCALALAAGTGLADVAERLGDLARSAFAGYAVLAAAIISLAALSFPEQTANREPGGRPDNLRALAAVLHADARPNDTVLFVPLYRKEFVTVYRDAFARLDTTALESGGQELPPARFRSAIATQSRIWVVETPPPRGHYRTPISVRNFAALRADRHFAKAGNWKFGTVRLRLFVRARQNMHPT